MWAVKIDYGFIAQSTDKYNNLYNFYILFFEIYQNLKV